MEIVNEYLELCKIQYEKRLNFKINAAENCNNLPIPRMLIQMLTENAIKHGISECVQPGDLLIDIWREDKCLNLKVSNSGALENKPVGSRVGIGINNIRERLHLLYGEYGKFSINQVNELVVAHVNIPFYIFSIKTRNVSWDR